MRIVPGWFFGVVGISIVILAGSGCATVTDYFTQPAIIDASNRANAGTANQPAVAQSETAPPKTDPKTEPAHAAAVNPSAASESAEAPKTDPRILISRIPAATEPDGPVRPAAKSRSEIDPAVDLRLQEPAPVPPVAAAVPEPEPTPELLKPEPAPASHHEEKAPADTPPPVVKKVEISEIDPPQKASQALAPADKEPRLREEPAEPAAASHNEMATPEPAATEAIPLPVQKVNEIDHTALLKPAAGNESEQDGNLPDPGLEAKETQPHSLTPAAPAGGLEANPTLSGETKESAIRNPQSAMPFSLERTATDLERRLTREPNNIYLQVALRNLYAAAGKKDKALAPLPIPLDQQAAGLALARAALGLNRTADPDGANEALDAIRDLAERLAAEADLRVRNVKICSENGVKGFGIYEELPRERLASGKPGRILIYCELENFRNEKNAENKYSTRLQAQMTIYDSHYRPVAQRPAEEVRDVPSANPRHDFFLRGPLELPALAPGKYLLEVRMEDKVAGKIARPGLVEFEVTGPTPPPASVATTSIPKAN